MALLLVTTQDGSVFEADVDFLGRSVAPVVQYAGPTTIGFNPQDRFMVGLNEIDGGALLVITQDGSVYGAGVDIPSQSSVYLGPFAGPNTIGYNPWDRFMVALGNTIFVITQDGSVFGAWVDFPGQADVRPVMQYAGPNTIGFNPQDRFMVGLENTLFVITQDGSVYGADVLGQSVGPVVQYGGPHTIGYNPSDQFMVGLWGDRGWLGKEDALFVIQQDGSVFSAAVDFAGQTMGPVVAYAGAKIGYNPWDRFMVGINAL
jgi:hypothetical protein